MTRFMFNLAGNVVLVALLLIGVCAVLALILASVALNKSSDDPPNINVSILRYDLTDTAGVLKN